MKPNRVDLQRAFSVTNLEPEIPEEVLVAYASGQATALDRDLVEAMLEVDPTLSQVIETIREELASVNEPLPSGIAVPHEPRKPAWRARWLPAAGWLTGLAVCGALVFGLVVGSRALQDERSRGRRLTSEIQASRDRIADLQQRLSTDRTDKRRLVAELEQARNTLRKEQVEQEGLGVDALVAHALTKGLSLPPMAQLSAVRGGAELRVSMSPDRTSVRLPVRLAWTGAGKGDYLVEVIKGEQEIWNSAVTGSGVTPPKGLLEPGVVYTWRVGAGGNRSRDAEFRVCTRKEEAQANRIAGDRKLGPLEKGVSYASLGLVPEARAQFDLLQASHPSLAKRFIAEIEKYQQSMQGF